MAVEREARAQDRHVGEPKANPRVEPESRPSSTEASAERERGPETWASRRRVHESNVFELTGVPSSLRAVGREALAFARQAVLLHRDVASTLPERVREGEDVVVLLHGLFATAGVLRPLRRSIEQDAE